MAWGGPKIPMMPMTWFPGAFGKKRQTAPVAAEALDMPHGMLTGGAGGGYGGRLQSKPGHGSRGRVSRDFPLSR